MNKVEGPTSKKTKEPPKRVNHMGNIKFLNPFLLQVSSENVKSKGFGVL
jgi:hypothetical protein